MILHSLSWPRAAATTSCAVLHEQDNIEIYMNRPEHVSAPNDESTDLCRLILRGSSTHQNCVCPWIYGSAPSISVWTCWSADPRLRRSVTVQMCETCEVIRRLSSHRTSGLQNFRQRCHVLVTEINAIRWLSATYKILSNCAVLFCTVSQVLTASTSCGSDCVVLLCCELQYLSCRHKPYGQSLHKPGGTSVCTRG